MPLILGANSVSGYTVKNSLRFNSGSSDYLNKTFGTATNRKIFTFSLWVKRSAITGDVGYLMSAGTNASTNIDEFYFKSTNVLGFSGYESSVTQFDFVTTQLFRDLSAWYHVVVAYDSTQATSTNRVKIYINGSQVTSFSTATYPTLNFEPLFNSATAHTIARNLTSGSKYFDGYMSEYYFIDGQALTPSSFGETDTLSGIWIPKAYTGTYGTNGFNLQFKNSASLGTDSSGNGNTFTVNNLTSVDQSTDTPTNNFCTLNSLDAMKTNGAVVSEGNLKSLGSTTTAIGVVTGTIGVSQGKWYWEVSRVGTGIYAYVGVGEAGIGNLTTATGYGVSGFRSNGDYYANGSPTSVGTLSTWNTASDIIMIAMDMDNGAIYYGKNGSWLNSGVPTSGASRTGAVTTFTPTGFPSPLAGGYDTTNGVNCNFGNPPYTGGGFTDGAGYGNFSYSVPSGYYALCTKNLATFG
jgi:hypothetical protein